MKKCSDACNDLLNFLPAMDTKLGIDVTNMGSYRAFGDNEFLFNFTVGAPLDELGQYLFFALRQPIETCYLRATPQQELARAHHCRESLRIRFAWRLLWEDTP